MSKYDNPIYRDLCSLVDKTGDVLKLQTKKFNDKVTFTIIIENQEGKLLAKKTQFRNQTLDEMANDLLTANTKWIDFEK